MQNLIFDKNSQSPTKTINSNDEFCTQAEFCNTQNDGNIQNQVSKEKHQKIATTIPLHLETISDVKESQRIENQMAETDKTLLQSILSNEQQSKASNKYISEEQKLQEQRYDRKSFEKANQESCKNPVKLNLKGSHFFQLKSSNQLIQDILSGKSQNMATCTINMEDGACNSQISQISQLSTNTLLNKNIPSEEVLDYVRFTYTDAESQPANQNQIPKSLNTITLSTSILADPQQFLTLCQKIVGNDFLNNKHDINSISENQQIISCTLPSWLDVQEYHSPSKWLIAMFEIALQYHYNIFVQSVFSDKEISQSGITTSENQLIDHQNKIFEILQSLKISYLSDQKVLLDLIDKCEGVEIKELSMIIALFMNQEPHQLATDLCLTSIYKLHTTDFESEREFINLLIQMSQTKVSDQQKKAIKNQKKKNKRKQKKAQQLQVTEQIISAEDPQEEVKQQPIKNDKSQYLDQQNDQGHDFRLLKDDLNTEVDVTINKSKRKESHKEPRDQLDFQDIFSDSNIFQLLELEGNKENDGSPHNERLDKLSSFSDSTVDILGNFSSDHFKTILKSPQHSTNTDIELDIRKNLYSSDAGDSSIQLQKQFSDYYYMRDSSNINIDPQNQTKTKESLDNLQIDVSISNDTMRHDDSARNKSGKKVTLQLQQIKQFTPQALEESINNFQIIRSSQSYLNEQQAMKNNQQRRKKNKNGKKGSKGLNNNNPQFNQQSAHQKQMNNFIRNMLQHQQDLEDEEFDEYGQEEGHFEQTKVDNVSKANISQTESSKKTMYVKKQNANTNNPPVTKHITQEFSRACESPGNPIKSSVQYSSHKMPAESQQSQSDSQRSIQFTDTKKKKNYKSKKSSNNNWEKGGNTNNSRKKTGKSKGSQPTQGQLNKQHSYDPQYNQGFSLSLNRQSSLYESQGVFQSDLLNPLLNGGQLDMEEFKQILQQTIIQDTIQAQIQAQQQLLLQQNQFNTQEPETQQEYEQDDENIDDEEAREQKITETFFELLEVQMINYQKQIERKLESVRKERETAIQIIRNIVANLYRDERNSVAVKLYGSMASNLSIDTSDVDLAVVGLDFQGSREKQINEMRKLMEQINLIMKKSTKSKFIETATVPVIKLEVDLVQIAKNQERNEKNEFGQRESSKKIAIDDNMRYLGIDITFEDAIKQHYYGVHVDNLSRINLGIKCINYIKELCKDQPGLQTIVLILKKLLQLNDLNQTFTGGLNSYSIVLMTTAYLKQFHSVHSISKNLMEFFHYFGEYYDPKSIYINSQQYPHFVRCQFFINDSMIIQDPLDANNNPARGAYQIGKIQSVFKEAYQVLVECLNQFKQDQQEINVIQILMNHSSQVRKTQQLLGINNTITNNSQINSEHIHTRQL